MEENQVVYKCNTNHGLTSGILELYSDKLVYTSNKGAVTTYNYADITKAVSSMGCLEVKFTNGTSDAFSVDKELRLQMIDYINNKQIVQENSSKVQQTQSKTVSQTSTINFKDISNNMGNLKNLDTDKKNMIIGIVAIIIIGFIVIKLFSGLWGDDSIITHSAEIGAGQYITRYCGNVPASAVDYSVYKVKDQKCILECKSSNEAVVSVFGKKFYAGFVKTVDGGGSVCVKSSLAEVKEAIDW